MRWPRLARWGAAGLGIGTAVALYVLTGDRHAVAPPAEPVETDPAATAQSGAGVDTHYVLDEERWRLEYGRQRVYPDRVEWDHVRLTITADGTVVRADRCDAEVPVSGDAQPRRLNCEGNIHLETGEGASVEGEAFRYQDGSGLTEVSGPVTFARGRLAGRGTGATYERQGGVFRVLADAVLTVAGGTAEGRSIEGVGDSLVFNRAVRAVLLEGGARITQGADVMSGESATLYLDEEEEGVRVIELRGHARVEPSADGEARPPAMQADDIDLAFHEGTDVLERGVLSGQARLVTDAGRRSIAARVISFTMAADGTTVTHLEASEGVVVRLPATAGGAPERRVEAAALLATGSEAAHGLTAAVFSGGVRYAEAAGGARTGRSGEARALRLQLGGSLDDIQQAEFQDEAVFEDGSIRGEADVGIYDTAGGGSLHLLPASSASRRSPLVTDDALRVEATRRIEIDLATRDLHALGQVRTVTQSGEGEAQGGGPFGGSEPMYGFAGEFWYDASVETARYAGTPTERATVQQGESVVRGDHVRLRRSPRDLVAEGRVESRLRMGGPSAGGPPSASVATAATMRYDEGGRTVTYEGGPATVETPEGRVEAARVVVTLDDRREVRALQAAGNPASAEATLVHATLREGQEVLSETLTYDRATHVYTVRGRPFVLRTANDDGTCSESRGASGQFTPGQTASVPPGSANPGGVSTQIASCTGPLTR